MLNDQVVPFFEKHDLMLLRILTDRGTEYCGVRDQHEYQLYLAIEDIDRTKTKAKSPQTTLKEDQLVTYPVQENKQ